MTPEAEKPLTGQFAVVTGSAKGIGRAIALELARAGAGVMVHARASQQAASQTAAAIADLGLDSPVELCDLADCEARDQFVQRAFQWRPIDIWVNNAGADVLTGTAGELAFEAKLEQLWAVDVQATIHLSRAAGARMKERGRGVILNMGWDQEATGMAGESGEMFAAVKGAIAAFSRSLAKSLAPEVRVNCLAPGWIKTDWAAEASEYWQQRARRESLLNRWGTPEDVARVARFLASGDAEFINGQVININGGYQSGESENE